VIILEHEPEVLDLTVMYDLDSTHLHLFFIPIIGEEKKSLENRRVTRRFFEILQEEIELIYSYYEKARSDPELRKTNINRISNAESDILVNIPGETALEKLETIGRKIYQSLFPIQIRKYLNDYSISSLVINSEKFFVPFELMHDGKVFLATEIEFFRNPIFKEGEKENPSISAKAKQLPGTIVFFTNPTKDLEEAESEVTQIIDFFREKEKLNLEIIDYYQAGANYNVLANIFPRPRLDIFHYSGHSKITKNDLHFDLLDYPFSINDISLHYPSLFFLNMCEADISVQHRIVFKGYETLNFPMALMKQGAKACIATIWPIVDSSAAEFAVLFYEQIIKGESFGKAICYAKKELAETSDPNDITWMSFLLYGNPNNSFLDGIIEKTEAEIFAEVINILHILVIHKHGLEIFSKSLNIEGVKIQPIIVAGFLRALIDFAKEIFKFQDGLSELAYGENTLLIVEGEFTLSVLVLGKKPSIFHKTKLNEFSIIFEKEYQKDLDDWNGDISIFRNTGDLIDEIFDSWMIYPHKISSKLPNLNNLQNPISSELFKIARNLSDISNDNIINIHTLVEQGTRILRKTVIELYVGIEELIDKNYITPVKSDIN
jgi:hypothetical protein